MLLVYSFLLTSVKIRRSHYSDETSNHKKNTYFRLTNLGSQLLNQCLEKNSHTDGINFLDWKRARLSGRPKFALKKTFVKRDGWSLQQVIIIIIGHV